MDSISLSGKLENAALLSVDPVNVQSRTMH